MSMLRELENLLRDIAEQRKSEADAMEATLLAYLESVDAETPSDFPPKRKKKQAKPKATASQPPS